MKVKGGNNLEFSQLFDKYQSKVYRLILRMVKDQGEAEELTQDTFYKVYKNLASLKDPEKVSSWVYRIATNVALDHVRQPSYRKKRGQIKEQDRAEVETLSQTNTPMMELERSQTASCVRQFAEGLPSHYRVVLILHDLEGLPLKEVAEAMGASIAATKVRLHRARKQFAALCSQECEQFYSEENILCCQPKSDRGLAVQGFAAQNSDCSCL